MNLPALGHDVSGLLNYQATAGPDFHGTYTDVMAGSVAGSTLDQEGDNGYINGFSGSQRGVVPTPVESIQEVTVNTNNSTADFTTSSGAEMLAVTKRGSDSFHGAAFDFLQSSVLNANGWENNFNGTWMVQMPPVDQSGTQDVLVDAATNLPITWQNYIRNRYNDALNGEIYTPEIGFSPVGAVGKGSKYAFPPYWGQFGPHVSLAWNPTFHGGILGKIFGDDGTVFRGGYSRLYGRDLGINVVSTPVLGYGFLQPDSCIPDMTGACVARNSATPANAFRMGSNADGTTVPFGRLRPRFPRPPCLE